MLLRLSFAFLLLTCLFSKEVGSFIFSSIGTDCEHGIMTEHQIRRFEDCLPVSVRHWKGDRQCIFFRSLRYSLCGMGQFPEGAKYICHSTEYLSCEHLSSATTTNATTLTETTRETSSTQTATIDSVQHFSSCPPCLPCSQTSPSPSEPTTNNFRHYHWIEILKR